MIEPDQHANLKKAILQRIQTDRFLLDQLRAEIRPLLPEVRRIQPRNTTAISLVGTDGGQNRLEFDPFLVQMVRVVDSSNNEYCLDIVSPTTNLVQKSDEQFDAGGRPRTPLGELMAFLDVRYLPELSPMIRADDDGRPLSRGWVETYRELMEWAVLLSIVRNNRFGSDTLLVFDGLLRTKIFARGLFKRYLDGMTEALVDHWQRSKRNVYVVGVAKHSKVLSRYRLAMALEGVLTVNYPAYVAVPTALERKSYIHPEFAWEEGDSGRQRAFTGGKLFLVKFGNRPHDPIWPIDIYRPQLKGAPAILGHLLSDAQNGFPVPFYPLCLQRAHEHAALTGFDMGLMQDYILDGVRVILDDLALDLDMFRLQDGDPAQQRYGQE